MNAAQCVATWPEWCRGCDNAGTFTARDPTVCDRCDANKAAVERESVETSLAEDNARLRAEVERLTHLLAEQSPAPDGQVRLQMSRAAADWLLDHLMDYAASGEGRAHCSEICRGLERIM